MNKKTGDILGWLLGFTIVFGGTFLVVAFDPLLYTFIGVFCLWLLSFPVLAVMKLVQITAELSDEYTNLPRLSTIKPLKGKVFALIFGLLLSFTVFAVLGVIPFIYLKIIGFIYLAWVFYILLGWLDKGGIKANARELTTIASVILKGIGILGGIYILVNLPNSVSVVLVLVLFLGPIVFGSLWNLFIWIKNRKK